MDNDSRLRPFYVKKLLEELTDEQHQLTTNEIVDLLEEKYGIRTQRTRIPQDIELLQKLGVDIDADVLPGRPTRYRILNRVFEPVELKLLTDAVYSSLFLSGERTEELREKLLGLTSVYTAENIRKTVVDNELLKHDNANIMYIVDALVRAILQKRQVAFRYFHYDMMKRRVNSNDNMPHLVSPYALVWENDNYYLVGFSEKYQKIAHFRVDRIAETPKVLSSEGVPMPEGFDLVRYKSTMIRMYNSKRVRVELACDESVMDSIVDKFGLDVETGLIDDHRFSVSVEVAVNHIFYSWVFGFGGKVSILNPQEVVDGYADLLVAASQELYDRT